MSAAKDPSQSPSGKEAASRPTTFWGCVAGFDKWCDYFSERGVVLPQGLVLRWGTDPLPTTSPPSPPCPCSLKSSASAQSNESDCSCSSSSSSSEYEEAITISIGGPPPADPDKTSTPKNEPNQRSGSTQDNLNQGSNGTQKPPNGEKKTKQNSTENLNNKDSKENPKSTESLNDDAHKQPSKEGKNKSGASAEKDVNVHSMNRGTSQEFPKEGVRSGSSKHDRHKQRSSSRSLHKQQSKEEKKKKRGARKENDVDVHMMNRITNQKFPREGLRSESSKYDRHKQRSSSRSLHKQQSTEEKKKKRGARTENDVDVHVMNRITNQKFPREELRSESSKYERHRQQSSPFNYYEDGCGIRPHHYEDNLVLRYEDNHRMPKDRVRYAQQSKTRVADRPSPRHGPPLEPSSAKKRRRVSQSLAGTESIEMLVLNLDGTIDDRSTQVFSCGGAIADPPPSRCPNAGPRHVSYQSSPPPAARQSGRGCPNSGRNLGQNLGWEADEAEGEDQFTMMDPNTGNKYLLIKIASGSRKIPEKNSVVLSEPRVKDEGQEDEKRKGKVHKKHRDYEQDGVVEEEEEEGASTKPHKRPARRAGEGEWDESKTVNRGNTETDHSMTSQGANSFPIYITKRKIKKRRGNREKHRKREDSESNTGGDSMGEESHDDTKHSRSKHNKHGSRHGSHSRNDKKRSKKKDACRHCGRSGNDGRQGASQSGGSSKKGGSDGGRRGCPAACNQELYAASWGPLRGAAAGADNTNKEKTTASNESNDGKTEEEPKEEGEELDKGDVNSSTNTGKAKNKSSKENVSKKNAKTAKSKSIGVGGKAPTQEENKSERNMDDNTSNNTSENTSSVNGKINKSESQEVTSGKPQKENTKKKNDSKNKKKNAVTVADSREPTTTAQEENADQQPSRSDSSPNTVENENKSNKNEEMQNSKGKNKNMNPSETVTFYVEENVAPAPNRTDPSPENNNSNKNVRMKTSKSKDATSKPSKASQISSQVQTEDSLSSKSESTQTDFSDQEIVTNNPTKYGVLSNERENVQNNKSESGQISKTNKPAEKIGGKNVKMKTSSKEKNSTSYNSSSSSDCVGTGKQNFKKTGSNVLPKKEGSKKKSNEMSADVDTKSNPPKVEQKIPTLVVDRPGNVDDNTRFDVDNMFVFDPKVKLLEGKYQMSLNSCSCETDETTLCVENENALNKETKTEAYTLECVSKPPILRRISDMLETLPKESRNKKNGSKKDDLNVEKDETFEIESETTSLDENVAMASKSGERVSEKPPKQSNAREMKDMKKNSKKNAATRIIKKDEPSEIQSDSPPNESTAMKREGGQRDPETKPKKSDSKETRYSKKSYTENATSRVKKAKTSEMESVSSENESVVMYLKCGDENKKVEPVSNESKTCYNEGYGRPDAIFIELGEKDKKEKVKDMNDDDESNDEDEKKDVKDQKDRRKKNPKIIEESSKIINEGETNDEDEEKNDKDQKDKKMKKPKVIKESNRKKNEDEPRGETEKKNERDEKKKYNKTLIEEESNDIKIEEKPCHKDGGKKDDEKDKDDQSKTYRGSSAECDASVKMVTAFIAQLPDNANSHALQKRKHVHIGTGSTSPSTSTSRRRSSPPPTISGKSTPTTELPTSKTTRLPNEANDSKGHSRKIDPKLVSVAPKVDPRLKTIKKSILLLSPTNKTSTIPNNSICEASMPITNTSLSYKSANESEINLDTRKRSSSSNDIPSQSCRSTLPSPSMSCQSITLPSPTITWHSTPAAEHPRLKTTRFPNEATIYLNERSCKIDPNVASVAPKLDPLFLTNKKSILLVSPTNVTATLPTTSRFEPSLSTTNTTLSSKSTKALEINLKRKRSGRSNEIPVHLPADNKSLKEADKLDCLIKAVSLGKNASVTNKKILHQPYSKITEILERERVLTTRMATDKHRVTKENNGMTSKNANSNTKFGNEVMKTVLCEEMSRKSTAASNENGLIARSNDMDQSAVRKRSTFQPRVDRIEGQRNIPKVYVVKDWESVVSAGAHLQSPHHPNIMRVESANSIITAEISGLQDSILQKRKSADQFVKQHKAGSGNPASSVFGDLSKGCYFSDSSCTLRSSFCSYAKEAAVPLDTDQDSGPPFTDQAGQNQQKAVWRLIRAVKPGTATASSAAPSAERCLGKLASDSQMSTVPSGRLKRKHCYNDDLDEALSSNLRPWTASSFQRLETPQANDRFSFVRYYNLENSSGFLALQKERGNQTGPELSETQIDSSTKKKGTKWNLRSLFGKIRSKSRSSKASTHSSSSTTLCSIVANSKTDVSTSASSKT